MMHLEKIHIRPISPGNVPGAVKVLEFIVTEETEQNTAEHHGHRNDNKKTGT
jgi:hypothetical protein